MRKKLLAMVLSMCMTAALVGCGQNQVEEKPNESPQEQMSEVISESESVDESKEAEEEKDYTGITFRVAWWGNDVRAENTVKILDEFAKQFPGLTVETEYCGYGDYYTKINTQAAGNNLPDVMQMEYTAIPTYADSDLLLDITSYVEDGSVDLSKVDESMVAACKYQGILCGIPTGINVPAMTYNATLLEELGLGLSKTPTVSEFVEVAKAVYEKTGTKSGEYDKTIYYRSLGGDEYATEGRALGYDLDMLTYYLTDLAEGVREGYFFGYGDALAETVEARFELREIWNQGGGAWSNSFTSIDSKTTDEMELCAYPIADDATVPNATYAKPNTVWTVNKNTEHPEIAAAFLDFFNNNQFVYDTCGIDRGIPCSSIIRDYMESKATESETKVYEFITYLEENNCLSEINTNIPADATVISNIFTEAEEPIRYGEVAPEDIPAIAEQIIADTNELLQQ